MSDQRPNSIAHYLRLATGVTVVIAICAVWQIAVAQTISSVSANGVGKVWLESWEQRSYSEKMAYLESLDSVRLDELRRRMLKFDELSDTQRLAIEKMHRQLDAAPDGEALRSVMYRYYRWLKTLDEKTRSDLLDLQPDERIRRIRELRDQQAKASFGRVGETKLPDEDVSWVYEWVKQTVEIKRDDIDKRLDSDEIKNRLPASIRSMASRPSVNTRHSNYRFLLLVNYAPEIAREIAYEEFTKLYTGLSLTAKEIVDGYGENEQKELVVQWFKAADYARNNVTDEELFQFWKSLSVEEHEILDQLSADEWRAELEKWYFRALRRVGQSPATTNRSNPDVSRRSGG